jgi:hypothetical protein
MTGEGTTATRITAGHKHAPTTAPPATETRQESGNKRGQVGEDFAEAPGAQRGDVFHEDVAGS